MDEPRDPQTPASDEGELLAAYLDASTDDVTSARIERMLGEDPQAAARLDALARTRARLQRLDDVELPASFHERLHARLKAQRARDEQASTLDAEPNAAASEPVNWDRLTAPRARTDQSRHRWFAPLTAAAALILLVVIGVAALLNQTATTLVEESAEAPAEQLADSPDSAPAPLARDDAGAESAEEAEGPLAASAGPTSTRATPRVPSDSHLVARLQRPAQSTDDPVAREFELRVRAGLPAAPVCLANTDATAVDLVELRRRQVVAALIDSDDGPDVVVFDALSCERLRTIAIE